ncbi:MAG: hypothetical protein IPM06_17440 [Rhizobiales bacterium]|nr:hypothetical protein [Hyphomicrobiales bacterium]
MTTKRKALDLRSIRALVPFVLADGVTIFPAGAVGTVSTTEADALVLAGKAVFVDATQRDATPQPLPGIDP